MYAGPPYYSILCTSEQTRHGLLGELRESGSKTTATDIGKERDREIA